MKTIYLINFIGDINSAYMNHTLAIAKGLGESGVDVKVFLLPSNIKNERVDIIYKNVEFIYLWELSKIKRNYHFSLLFSLWKLFFLLKDDIPVIVFGVSQYLFLFRLKKNIKLYHEITEHPDFFYWMQKRYARYILNLYFRTCRKLDGLFVISSSLKEYYANNVYVSKEKIYILNMFVDSSRFNNVVRDENSNYISYCGTISEYKDGVDILIKAFSILHKRYPDYILQIIGPFQNINVKNRLVSMVEDLQLVDCVSFLGKVPSENMPNILAASKLLVLARPQNKQAQYGFPTKLGEYLMTGVPVVVTEVGDLNRYLTNGENVIFAEPNSVENFANRMLWSIDNYSQSLEIGMNGREFALKNFNYLEESKKICKILNL